MPHRRLFRSLLKHHPRATRAYFQALTAKLGPFDAVTRAYAQAAVAMWWSFAQATMELGELEAKRRTGRGRRPSVQAVERLRKRQGVAFESYDGALRRLEEQTARHRARHAPTPSELLHEVRAGRPGRARG